MGRGLSTLGAVALGAALGLAAATAHAAPPAAQVATPPEDPELYVDPSYDPGAHGGLSYVSYLRMSRGTERRSTGMMATGIAIAGLSTAMFAVGTAVYLGGNSCQSSPLVGFNTRGASCSHGAGHTSGMAMLLASTIGVAIGVPLWVLGGTQIPYREASGANDRAAPSWARLVPAVSPAAASRGVELTWRF
jgi:hypothetical protein